MNKTYCTVCAGEIPYEDGAQIVKCPFCGTTMHVSDGANAHADYHLTNETYARQNQEAEEFLRDLEQRNQRDKEESVGDLKLVVQRGKSMWSLADESTYWFVIDDQLDVRVPAMKNDISATVTLPAGTHSIYLKIFGWDDKACNECIHSVDTIHVYVPKGGICTVEANRPGMFGKYTMKVV